MWTSHAAIRISGIPVTVSGLFAPLASLVVISGAWSNAPDRVLLYALAYVIVLFCIFLHELGHVFAGRLAGVRCHSIFVTPFGCVAKFEDDHVRSEQQLLLIGGGPLVSLILTVSLIGLNGGVNWADPSVDLLNLITIGNVVVLLLNLLPAYPLDGGALINAVARRFIGDELAMSISHAITIMASLTLFGLGIIQHSGSMLLLGAGLLIYGPYTLKCRSFSTLKSEPRQ